MHVHNVIFLLLGVSVLYCILGSEVGEYAIGIGMCVKFGISGSSSEITAQSAPATVTKLLEAVLSLVLSKMLNDRSATDRRYVIINLFYLESY